MDAYFFNLNYKTIIFFVLLLATYINVVFYTGFYTSFPMVETEDIESVLVYNTGYELKSILNSTCPIRPVFSEITPPVVIPVYKNVEEVRSLIDDVYSTYDVWETKKTYAERYDLRAPGIWSQIPCRPRHVVAIIVPHRCRRNHLGLFLYQMHPFLQKQKIFYQIITVEQMDNKPFNRGKLMNIGYKEVLRVFPVKISCLIFHDVDLIPQNINNIYGCTNQPRHMSTSISKFRYNLPYDSYFGGVVAMTPEQFNKTNGFSNSFYGWGGEDDDFYNRVIHAGFQPCRFDPFISKYYALPHPQQEASQDRLRYLNSNATQYQTDGLNSLEYKIHSRLGMYTHINVEAYT